MWFVHVIKPFVGMEKRLFINYFTDAERPFFAHRLKKRHRIHQHSHGVIIVSHSTIVRIVCGGAAHRPGLAVAPGGTVQRNCARDTRWSADARTMVGGDSGICCTRLPSASGRLATRCVLHRSGRLCGVRFHPSGHARTVPDVVCIRWLGLRRRPAAVRVVRGSNDGLGIVGGCGNDVATLRFQWSFKWLGVTWMIYTFGHWKRPLYFTRWKGYQRSKATVVTVVLFEVVLITTVFICHVLV